MDMDMDMDMDRRSLRGSRLASPRQPSKQPITKPADLWVVAVSFPLYLSRQAGSRSEDRLHSPKVVLLVARVCNRGHAHRGCLVYNQLEFHRRSRPGSRIGFLRSNRSVNQLDNHPDSPEECRPLNPILNHLDFRLPSRQNILRNNR
jgi:hypothetical protein